jgi:RNA polymerase sigma-70 factor, ECF subfamily
LAKEPRAESVAARGEGWIEMRRMLAKLPDDLAQAVVYYYIDEMTHAEIAEQLGCSRRQVGNLLERAAAHWQKEEARA